MKKLSLLLSLVFTIGLPAVTPAFEGVIVQKSTYMASHVNPGTEAMEKMLQRMPPQQRKAMEQRMKEAVGPGSSEPDVSTQTIYIKGSKMRMDSGPEQGERTFMVMDMQERVVRNVFPERKVYMEMSLDQVEQMGQGLSEMRKGLGENGGAEKVGKLKKTRKKREINGYDCQLYTQQVGEDTNEYWITKEFTVKEIMGEFADRMKSFGKGGGLETQQEALMEIDGYPMLTVTRNRYGTSQNEVMKIEKKGLSDDLFAIPSGYRKRSMQEMMTPKQ